MSAKKTNGIKRNPAGRSPSHELREVSADARITEKMLDLVHVTAVGAGRDIIDERQINTNKCSVFEKDLVYAFAGRPAYKLKDGDSISEQINRFPIVFVISPEKLGAPYHVYPFDTGAGVAGRYDNAADPYVTLEDYKLAPNLIAVQKHISWAFGSNEAYFEGEVKAIADLNLAPWKEVALSCLAIARLAAVGSNHPDKRASAVEIAFSEHISLKEHVRLVILPDQFLERGIEENAPYKKALRELGIEYAFYRWEPNSAPDDHMDEIARITREHIFSKRNYEKT